MITKFMVFSALLMVPLSAMMCTYNLLYFFILFPMAAIVTGKWKYCQRLFFLLLSPFMVLVWAHVTGNNLAVVRSVRWICALATGTFFASELGTAGMADVFLSMKSLPYTKKFSELLLMAGSTASNVRLCWAENADLPLVSRILRSSDDSVSKACPTRSERRSPGRFTLLVAVFSWIFMLVSISGIMDGVVR